MSRELSRCDTYTLQPDDPHRLDDFFEEVVQNSRARERRARLAVV